jgi:RNA polymerase sigma-70 factor (ECF subfamily)
LACGWRAGEDGSRVLRDCKKLTEGAVTNTHETSRESGLIRNGNGALADEQKLVVQAKSGDSSAFGELYERHQLKIYRSAFRILRNEQDAEDAVQQSFQRAFVNLHRFRGDSAFATWVTRIAINEALMMLRRRRVTTPLFETSNDDVNPTSPIDLPDDRPTPEQAFAEKESRAVVAQAISRLRNNLRTVALLRELQGLSNAETARRLGLTVTAVKARTFHARRHLREHLEGKCTGPRIDFSRRCIDARIRASSMINNEHHDVIH